MRLIDADDVIETISHYLGKKLYALYPNDKMPDFDKGVIDGYARARSIVFETPTVYPMKQGRWIKMSDADGIYYACSKCGEELTRIEKFDPQFDLFPRLKSIDKTPFCPHCGAKMDEVEE